MTRYKLGLAACSKNPLGFVAAAYASIAFLVYQFQKGEIHLLAENRKINENTFVWLLRIE